MSALIKNVYNKSFYNLLAKHLKGCLPQFNEQEFMSLMLCDNFEALALKDRMHHTTKIVHHFMPNDFNQAADVLVALVESLTSSGIKEGSVEYMFLPDYIEVYGIEHLQKSNETMEFITQFTSGEFAVRPFLLKYGEPMLVQMFQWSMHEHYLVRRLASEGSRPRLPWAMALPAYKKNPASILPILQRLIDDPTEIVRRSAANNLNDIAKDNPQVVINFVKEHIGKNAQLDKTLKHASRTLLKQACPETLAIFGYDNTGLTLLNFEVLTPEVKFGEFVEFTFILKNNSSKRKKIRLEYGLYFMKKNGVLAKKVFKISERDLNGGEQHQIIRRQSFKAISTRVFYPGKHQVSIILNGKEFTAKDFILID